MAPFCQAADRRSGTHTTRTSSPKTEYHQGDLQPHHQGMAQRIQDTRRRVEDMHKRLEDMRQQFQGIHIPSIHHPNSDPLRAAVDKAASTIKDDLSALDDNTAEIEKTQEAIEAGRLQALERQEQQLAAQEGLLETADKNAGTYLKAEDTYYDARHNYVYPSLRSDVVGRIVSARSELAIRQAVMDSTTAKPDLNPSKIKNSDLLEQRLKDVRVLSKDGKKDGSKGTSSQSSAGTGDSIPVTAPGSDSKRLEGRMPPPQRGTLSAAQLIAGKPMGDAGMGRGQGRDAELLRQGEALIAGGKALEALNWAKRMVEAYPDDAGGHRLLANALSRLGRHEEAEKAALEAIRLDPDDPQGYIALAWAQIHLKKNGEALEAINRALALNPKDAKALVLRALIYEQLNMRDKMIEDLRQAAALDPRFNEHLRRALAGERLFDPDDPESYLLFEALARRRNPRAVPIGVGLGALCLLAAGFVLLRRRAGRAAEAAPADPAISEAAKRFAEKYRMTRRTGQAEHAELWEAHDATLGREVQVRRLSFEADGPGVKQRARALRDFTLLADMRHPGIEVVLEVVELGRELHVVLESTPWATAADIVKTSGRLPFDKVRVLLSKACDALSAAHKRGLLHRCVTPAKILVSDQGYVRLTDFGSWGGCQLEYRAPETEGGVEVPATDVYALGATLYALLVGSPPYDADVYARRTKREFKDPSGCAPGIPAAVDSLVRDALHPAASVRIQSVQTFLERLSKI
ncbi:MAG: tetratricopeptide repeat protein [Elusimicrobiota bacterium]